MSNVTNTAPANTAPATTAPKAPAKGKATGTKRAPAKGKGKAKAPAKRAPAKAKALPKGYGLRAQPTAVGKRRTAYAENAVVTMVSTANPKRPGTGAFARYAQYLVLAKRPKGFTVADVLAKGVQPSDIRYNVKHGHIKLSAPIKAKATPAKAKAPTKGK